MLLFGDLDFYNLDVTLEPACKVHGCKVFSDVRSILGWPQSKSAKEGFSPDVRSARLYGQFSLDKTLTLQAGTTVYGFIRYASN